ncbi:MAG TPA: hypothetical protein DEF06_10375, partial [Clostridiales bacterium]|nr:hypothetical protein [Clostridiales bacterium]
MSKRNQASDSVFDVLSVLRNNHFGKTDPRCAYERGYNTIYHFAMQHKNYIKYKIFAQKYIFCKLRVPRGKRSAAIFNQKNTLHRGQLQRYCGHGNSAFFGIEAVGSCSRPGMRIPEPRILDFPAK